MFYIYLKYSLSLQFQQCDFLLKMYSTFGNESINKDNYINNNEIFRNSSYTPFHYLYKFIYIYIDTSLS